MGVTIYFLATVNIRQSKDDIAYLSRGDSVYDMVEFKSVIFSCRPLMSFQVYLESNQPDYVLLLDFVKFYEQKLQY